MRARNNTYHVACFTCDICDRKLSPGDEIALRDNKLLCLMDCEVKVKDELKREDDRSETPGSAIEHSEGASEVNSSAESDEPPTVASPHGKGTALHNSSSFSTWVWLINNGVASNTLMKIGSIKPDC